MTKKNTNNKNNKKEAIKGGGFLDFISGDKKKRALSNAKSSELAFLESYHDYLKVKTKYDKVYNKHLSNLITLDQINQMGDSMVTVFKEILFPNDIEGYSKYNLANPLFLRSYLATNETNPADFRREHITQQVWYQIDKLHPNDKNLFTHVKVKLIDNKTVMVSFTLLNVNQYDRKVSISNNYILDADQINEHIDEVVGIVKSNPSLHTGQVKKVNLYEDDFLIKNEKVDVPGFNNRFVSNTKKLNNRLQRNSKTGKVFPQRKEIKPKRKEELSNNNRMKALLSYKSSQNNLKKDVFNSPNNKATGEDEPLTKKQILRFQHQQVIPVEDEPDEYGKPIFAVSDITDDVRELLGLEVKKQKKASFYDDIPLEKLKQMDLSQLSKENLDKICQRFSEDEDACKKIEQCWYNAKSNPKCYRFKGKDEA